MYDTYFVNRVLNIYYNRKHFGLNIDTIADIYAISKSTIYNCRNTPILTILENNSKRIFDKKPSIFKFDKIIDYDKIYNIVKNKFNKNISRKTIYNILKKNKITHKKVQTYKYPYSKNKFNKDVNVLRNSITVIPKFIYTFGIICTLFDISHTKYSVPSITLFLI